MTIQHMNLVFQAEGLNHSEKVVLLAYCNYTDPHGYVWAGVDRIADDTGASTSTVKRVRSALKAKNLLATKRRVDPRTGESIPNLTRINLSLLESMRRAPKEYDDNLVEALTFDSEEPSKPSDENPSDLRMDQSEPRADLRMDQSEPTPGLNLTPPYGGLNLTPNPSVHPSDSSSSGGVGASPPPKRPAEEEEETSSARRRGRGAVQVVMERTGASEEEADQVITLVREHAFKKNIRIASMSRYVAGFAAEDLEARLAEIRRQRGSEGRSGGSKRPRRLVMCSHHYVPVPCGACQVEIRSGETETAKRTLAKQGPENRPDLVEWLAPAST
ncbi:helix-turn-helix domain-containing protein (plasmid) [Thermobifida halotolerans]|uniref:Helix-turn-helix domain-containing protein n=1 Tax=Thermobifida halotolerans TaxID=483545 RepID=A0AA97M1M7_9ACTN|nr:helix-turn-helix domain-containing protein [Thermobifida halotolerans]UOE22297.1 helix-turn-helix domain-containing protein [Thermobifida halotolerans]